MKAKRNRKPAWPHRSVTRMTAHPNGQWCKKIRGKLYYFGPWHDPDGALRRWQAEAPDLIAGRQPTRYGDTLDICVNAWLTYQKRRMETGDIAARTYADYLRSGRYLLAGLGPQRHVGGISTFDWAGLRARMGKDFKSPNTTNKLTTNIRQCFKWAYEAQLIEKPIHFGPGFKPPSAKTKRLARAARGQRLFSPGQIRQLLKGASEQVRATILLGINGGFGNTDCAELRIEAVNLKDAVIDYARVKTGVPRTVPLWRETVELLRTIIGDRSEGLVFVSRRGNPLVRSYVNEKGNHTISDSVNREFGRLKKRLKVRSGLTFYDLRHTFRTIADECRDDRACDRIMGHVSQHLSADYVERIEIVWLRRVVNHVRAWLLRQSSRSPGLEGDDKAQEQEP